MDRTQRTVKVYNPGFRDDMMDKYLYCVMTASIRSDGAAQFQFAVMRGV